MYSHCTICKAELRPGDVDLERQFVSCSSCGSMFTFGKNSEELRRAASAAMDRLPNSRWTYERKEDLVRLSWPWASTGAALLLVLLVCALGVTLPTVVYGWITPHGVGHPEALVIAIAAVLLFGYPLLLSLLNRTFIEASPGLGVQVRHGPLPWIFLPRSVRLSNITQLYAKRIKRVRTSDVSFTYELRVLHPDGNTQHLVGNGLSAEEVLFLERVLEHHLGIEDQTVRGEFKPEGSA